MAAWERRAILEDSFAYLAAGSLGRVLRTSRQLWAASFLCAAAFAALLFLVYETEGGAEADALGLQGFEGLQRPTVAELSDGVAHLADPVPFALLSALLVFLALFRGRPLHAAAAGLLLIGANVTTQIAKPLLAHPRGNFGAYEIAAEAFPSGHATASMSLAMAAVIVAPSRLRPLVGVVGATFALAVSFSIISLDWHFPSDIGGGFLVAAGWAFASLALLRTLERRRGSEREGRAPAWGAGAFGLLLLLAVVAAVGARELPQLTGYAEGNTTFAVIAGATALLGAALVGAVLAAAGRR